MLLKTIAARIMSDEVMRVFIPRGDECVTAALAASLRHTDGERQRQTHRGRETKTTQRHRETHREEGRMGGRVPRKQGRMGTNVPYTRLLYT